jgi:hypothetical protein
MDARTAHILSLLSEKRSRESQHELIARIGDEGPRQIAMNLVRLVNREHPSGPPAAIAAAQHLYDATELRRS